MAELVDVLVKGGIGTIGVIASAVTLTKFILSTPVKVGDRSEEEKEVDVVLCFDAKKYGLAAVEFFVATVQQQSQLVISPQNVVARHHKDAPPKDDVNYLLGAPQQALMHIKNRKEKMLHAEIINERDASSFSSGERIDLIMFELNRLAVLKPRDTPDATIPLPFRENDDLFAEALHAKLVKDYFPLHDDEERHALVETWIKKWKDPQPIDAIRDYFGDDIGFYFAFLGMYTKWLIVPTIVALIVFGLELMSPWGAHARALYSLFITSWATAFLKFWKRRESVLRSHWGISTSDALMLHHERPDFKGERQYDPVEERHFTYFSSIRRMRRYMVTALSTGVVLAGILKLIFLYFELESWCTETITPEKGWEGMFQYASLMPSILYSVVVMIFDMKYSEFAIFLTKYENHRTDADFSNALVLKLASFYFVNNFGSLFFLAFRVRDMMQLQQMLSSLLITRQIIGNLKEQLVPFFMAKSSLKTEAGKIAQEEHVKEAVLSNVEAELLYPTYDGTFEDYLELFVQFGQVTLFASAYPLASLWSLANNIMEIRSDGFKLCASFRRSHRVATHGIGTWLYAFNALGYFSVMTNCAIFGLHSGMLDELIPSLSFAGLLAAIGVMEHAMLGVKVCIEMFVPDTPTSVLEARRMKRAALRKKAILQVELSARKLQLESGDSMDGSDALPASARSSLTEEEAARICAQGPEHVMEWIKQEKDRRHKVEEQVKSLNDVYMGWIREEQSRRKEAEQQLAALLEEREQASASTSASTPAKNN